MINLKYVLSSAALLASLTSIPAQAAEIDMKPGMWQWTMTTEMKGMPFALPPTTYSSCTTTEDLVPKQPKEPKGCKMLENKISGNDVTWKMECNGEGGQALSEGKMTYSGTTAKGEVQVTTQGMAMTSKISGLRTGECK